MIAGIISTLGPNHVRYQSTAVCPGSPIMKLRYLKLMYPEADEAILFDLLYNCDQNAMEAINRLEAMGYKRSETSRTASAKTETDSTKTGFKAMRPQSAPIAPKTSFPPNTAEKQRSSSNNLKPNIDYLFKFQSFSMISIQKFRGIVSGSQQNSHKYGVRIECFQRRKSKSIFISDDTARFVQIFAR